MSFEAVRMRKTLFTGITFAMLLFVTTASAAESITSNPAFQQLVDKINVVIRAFQAILILYAVAKLMYAGYLHMGSEGEPEKEKKARQAFVNTLKGLGIVVLAEVIRNAIVSLLG